MKELKKLVLNRLNAMMFDRLLNLSIQNVLHKVLSEDLNLEHAESQKLVNKVLKYMEPEIGIWNEVRNVIRALLEDSKEKK